MRYEAHIEAQGYGSAEAEGVALAEQLESEADELGVSVMADEQRGMVLLTLTVDGTDAVEVHDEAFGVWRTAWEKTFPEQPPPVRLAVTIVAATTAARNAEVNGARP